MRQCKIAIFASGSGSNAENIYNYFSDKQEFTIDSIGCNNPKAYVIERAKKLGIDCIIFDRNQFYKTNFVENLLKKRNIDLIVLAGFLWLIPENLTNLYPIINIHPALLPKYGGKGMYGMNVHRAVVENGEKETGITIHSVNSKYDEGKILFQITCKVLKNDKPEEVAQKVHQLEYQHYPPQIELFAKSVKQ